MVNDRETDNADGILAPQARSRRPFSVSAEELTWLMLAIGVVLRLLEFLENRALYMDEVALLDNLVDLPVFDFQTILSQDQLAPPGFLTLGRLLVRLPFLDPWRSARLVSLTCGIASMFLMRKVARRFISRQAVPVAVGLFAVADWMLYYSCEIKQYSCDAALALAALWLAAEPAAAWAPLPMAPSRKSHYLLAGFGALGVWFSFPLAFVLAGIGTYLIAASASRRRWKESLRYGVISVVWAASFAACVKVSYAILSKRDFIWDWWDFAFLRLPPRSLADLDQDFWQVLNVLNSPADVVTPLGVLPSAFFALGLFLAGAFALARRWPAALWLTVAPLCFGIAASSLHQYPFHGRLLLYLVPSIHLLVAEGAAVLARRGGSLLLVAVAGFLLYQPAVDVAWHHLIAKRDRGGFDSHGDLRPDLLDYLELRARKARQP
jgi:hypothetical protein